MEAPQLKLLLTSWGSSDPSLGPVEGDGFPLRLRSPLGSSYAVEVDQDPEVSARLVLRADVASTSDPSSVDAAVRSRAALLRASASEGRVRVEHPWYAEDLDRHAFMGALAEVVRAAGDLAEGSAAEPGPAPPAAEPAPAAPFPITPEPAAPEPAAPVFEPVIPAPTVTDLPPIPSPPVAPAPTPAPAVDAAALAALPAVWRRTHTTAPGARAWSAPNPALPPLMELAPGTELRVVERLGQWARVDASNGWTAWVDAQLLFPSPG